MFAGLSQLSGDSGASTLLSNAITITAPPAMLRDIDTLADLLPQNR
jgi:CTP:molybdopterin cytidylyltransferase MocA